VVTRVSNKEVVAEISKSESLPDTSEFMPRKVFKRVTPSPEQVKKQPYLRWMGDSVHRSDIWHITKHSVAGAFFIGVFCAFLPIPFQTVLAAVLALVFKRNLALSVGLVFLSNPITIPPIFFFTYKLGALLLGQPLAWENNEIEDLWQFMLDNFDQIGIALILGSVISGLFFATLAYFGIHLFWIWKVKHNWHLRRQNKLKKQDRISYAPVESDAEKGTKAPSRNS